MITEKNKLQPIVGVASLSSPLEVGAERAGRKAAEQHIEAAAFVPVWLV